MRRFDLELLHTFLAVMDAGSLSAASVKVGRSQSAVSEQIRKLEVFCNSVLFTRGKNGAKLTPAGERLAPHARRLLSANEAAQAEMAGSPMEGDLRLAITDYFRTADVARLLRCVRDRYPRLRLHVTILKSAEIEEAGNGFDLGLSMRILDASVEVPINEAVRATPLRREKLVWASGREMDGLTETALPLVVLPASCSLQSYTLAQLDKYEVPYYIAHSASGVGGLNSALAAGLGVGCLNISAMSSGVGIFAAAAQLPVLPEIEFALVAPRDGDPSRISVIERAFLESANPT
jgi:DNA-binding transcriptional LysR family regulator